MEELKIYKVSDETFGQYDTDRKLRIQANTMVFQQQQQKS